MYDLSSDVNNTPGKIPGWKPRAKIDVGNTIEYDMKSYQVKMAIVKCIKVWLKGLKLNGPQKYMLV